jgi:glycosyltransferase involved in cell wall biosynthesis
MNRVEMKDSVSVIIPAYNEEADIEEAVSIVSRLTSKYIKDYEIIVINDGSTDGTAEAIKRAAKHCKQLKVITHKKNLGFGIGFRNGIINAKKTYVTGFPADIDQSIEILSDLIRNRKKADIVSSYVTNFSSRPFIRKVFSKSFITLMNFVFHFNIRYYTGYFICRTDLVKKLKLISPNTAVLAEVKIRLIKQGSKFIEIPYETKLRQHGNVKALSLKNIFQTLQFIYVIIMDIYFK